MRPRAQTRLRRRSHDVRARSRALTDRLRLRDAQRDEDGFILLESIVAISLITIVLAALAQFTVNAVTSTNELRARQAATQLATTAMAALGAVPASDLVTGRDPASVNAQWNAAPPAVDPWLDAMNREFDTSAPHGSGPTAVVPTVATTQTLNSVDYEVQTYLGTCAIRSATSTDCVIGGTGGTLVRAVVAVTWEGRGCGSPSSSVQCTYVTATLLNRDSDPIFNTNRATPPITPAVVDPGNQVSTVGAIVSLLFEVKEDTGVPPYTWSLTAGTLPTGLTLSASGVVSGSPTAPITATPLTIEVTDAFGRTGTRDFTWTVVPAPTITTPGAQTSNTAQPVNLPIAATCPNGPCTYLLANAPAGLTIDPTTGVISGTPTTEGVSPAVTVTVTDSDAVTATTAPFPWTVLAAATISDPAPLNATVGNAKSRAIDYTCPAATCTITLLGTVPQGMGLSTSASTATNNTVTSLPVSRGDGTIYIAGTIQSSAVPGGSTSADYTPRVRITSGSTSVTSTSGSWTIYARPTVGAIGDRNASVGTTKDWPIAYTCANAPCTLTLTNTIPGLGLSATSGVTTANNTTTLTVQGTSGTVYVTGRVSDAAVPTGQGSRSYSASLTITDSDSAAVTSSGTWTATRAPRITNPGSQAVRPYNTVSLDLDADCPNGGCTWSAAAQSGSSGWTALPINGNGTINVPWYSVYPGVYTIRVTVTDRDGITDQVTFPLTVANFSLSIPNQWDVRPRNGTDVVTIDVSTLVSPRADGYTYTLTSAPSWLTISPDGVLTARIDRNSGADGSITVTVTSTASGSSTVSDTFSWNLWGP